MRRKELEDEDENEDVPEDADEELANLFNQRDESMGVQAIKELNSVKNIEMKSELNSKISEPFYATKLSMIAQLTNWKELGTYVSTMLILNVSKDRKGRTESVKVVAIPEQPKERRGLFGRMF